MPSALVRECMMKGHHSLSLGPPRRGVTPFPPTVNGLPSPLPISFTLGHIWAFPQGGRGSPSWLWNAPTTALFPLANICPLFPEDPVIRKFLAWDKNLQVSDKYLLSMVIAYFSRAGLFSWQFQRIHFFIALYVANDMEEDNQAPKQAIFSFLYGKNRSQRPLFHKLRLQFIRSMGWNARVTREECEQVGGLWRSGGGAGPERRWGSWGIRSGTWRRTRKNRTRGTGRQRHPHFQGLFVFPDPGF
ncbi:speedy protein E6-like isoform X1 [Balaenoptera musculus]|uniref:Speedy protein E6-like isoform X1 n=1 Tax=Balaenoptera musculus TaxID=9771 RepID=A0A8B8VB18_BALMU|nr:speedy protein E6-like isoform X1 [Balaenoptera musculus]